MQQFVRNKLRGLFTFVLLIGAAQAQLIYNPGQGGGSGSGTVTSVGITQTGTVFTIGGSPVTTNGNINLAFSATGMATFLATPSSANFFATLTTKTGSGGSVVFATGPTVSGLILSDVATGTQCLHANSSGVVSGTGSDCGSGGGGDTITSPNSTLGIGGTSTNTTLDVLGATGKILAGATPALTFTPALGVDGSSAGTFQLSNGAASAHTIFGSGATTTNTINGFATVPTTGHLIDCTVTTTTCLLHDSGVVTANVGLTTNALSQFAATTSAQLAGVISDETGTGVLVFGTSPTISTGFKLGYITGSTQCLHVDTTGAVTGTGSDCGSGGGAVSSVFTRSGAVVAVSGDYSLDLIAALAASKTWANGNNTLTVNSAQTTAGQVATTFGETTAATSTGTPYNVEIKTLIGSTSTPLKVDNSLNGSQTLPALSILPTWNTTGVVDAALLINATNTASGTASLLIDAQIGGTSQFKVDKAGNVTALTSIAVGNPTGGVGSSFFLTQEGTVPSGLSAAGQDNCYADSTQHGILCNYNAGTTLPLIQGPASNSANIILKFSGTNGGKAVASTLLDNGTTVSTTEPFVSSTFNTCPDTSASGSAQVCNTTPTFTPVAGSCVTYTTTTANTGTGLTLNVNSLGAKSVAKWQGATTLAANDVLANKDVLACYDGTNWELATIGNAPSGGGVSSVNTLTGAVVIENATAGQMAVSGGGSAALTGAADMTYSTHTFATITTGIFDWSAATGASSFKLPAVAGGTILAGTSTANLSAPIVIQNTNSSNSNTSITMGITAPGTSTAQTVLNVNGASTGGDLVDFGTGGTWTSGVLSGQTILASVLPTGAFQTKGATAGFIALSQGSTSSGIAPCNVANTHCIQAPTAVTASVETDAPAQAQGIPTRTGVAATIQDGYSGDANHSASVTIGSGTSIGSTSLCSTAICLVGTYRVNVYVDITTACGTTGTYVVNLIYTDDQGSKTVPVNLTGAGSVPATGVLTTTSTANFGYDSFILRSTGAASINYSTTAVACGTAGPMVGKMYLSAEPLQ